MTDYAREASTDPSWTWWMTTAATAAMRMRYHGDGSDPDDEFAGPNRKRQRFGDECWTDDSTLAGPLDLSVKATLTTAASVHVMRERSETGGSDDRYAATTPVKSKPAAGTTSVKSSRKHGGKTVTAAPTAVKAATRKLLPQLMLDHGVDRSSPVSGTIIVPADSAADRTSKKPSSSPPSPYVTTTATTTDGEGDDDYDGDDIDPEFNVVVATEEARRRLESIPNALGPYRCRLCSVRYADAFALARHRCKCIVHVRYRCPECDKVFQCPANLASHRRWHGTGASVKSSGGNNRSKNGSETVVKLEPAASPECTAVHEPTAAQKYTAVQRSTNNNDPLVVGNNVSAVTTALPTSIITITSTAPVSTVAGFKKNILHRAVQAAAAAANNNNNNYDDEIA